MNKGYSVGADVEQAMVNPVGLANCAIYRLPEKLDVLDAAVEKSAWAYHDGLNLEFGVRPSEDMFRLVDNVRDGIMQSRKWAEKFGFRLHFGDGAPIDMEDCKTKPGWDASGCNPTFNPRNGLTPAPAFPDYGAYMIEKGTLTGCHFHLSSKRLRELAEDREAKGVHNAMAVALAAVIPPYIWSMHRDTWTVERWKKLGVGNYRVPAHGFEYKDPGSAILISPRIFAAVFEAVLAISVCISEDISCQSLREALDQSIKESNEAASNMDMLDESVPWSIETVGDARETLEREYGFEFCSSIGPRNFSYKLDTYGSPLVPEDEWRLDCDYGGPVEMLRET